MPQNSRQNRTLFFDGNWGSAFKNSFATGIIAKVRPINATRLRTGVTELPEVGEDGTFVSSLIDAVRKTPIVGKSYTKCSSSKSDDQERNSWISGMGRGAETVVRIGLSNVTGQSISGSITSTPTLFSTVGKIESNFIVTKIILDPPIGVIKGAYQGFTRSD